MLEKGYILKLVFFPMSGRRKVVREENINIKKIEEREIES